MIKIRIYNFGTMKTCALEKIVNYLVSRNMTDKLKSCTSCKKLEKKWRTI